jgi:hypothetical protein
MAFAVIAPLFEILRAGLVAAIPEDVVNSLNSKNGW